MRSPFHAARPAIVAALILSQLLIMPARALAADAADALPPKLDEIIAKGLDFLAKQQQADGSVHGGGPVLAMTALTLMSFLASGHTPNEGKYALTIREATDFILSKAQDDGYFGRVDGSRMYGQGIITLALVEVQGVENDPERRAKIRAVVAKAIDLILRAQKINKAEPYAGGWRYEPQSADSDLSLSGWNALALRAAQNAGMAVPKEAVEGAVNFVLKCHMKDSGFAYQPGGGANPGMTGVGVLNLHLMDAADHPSIAPAAKFLQQHPVTSAMPHKYYYLYYTTQAAFQVGNETWDAVWRVTQKELLETQQPDGGWPPSNEPGRVYATSMAVLTLSVPYRLLPIYQR
jgi:hypothetical protein